MSSSRRNFLVAVGAVETALPTAAVATIEISAADATEYVHLALAVSQHEPAIGQSAPILEWMQGSATTVVRPAGDDL